MARVTALHHSSLLVSDLEEARAFYEGILGLTPSPKRPPLKFDGIWYELGEQQIHLLVLPNPDARREPPPHGGRDRHVALLIDDLEGMRLALEAAGIPYTFSQSGRPAIFCRDPEGNGFELIEPPLAIPEPN
jgi:catechol 2,3-dioxygenase-like lactoylglutathione lyase family enzyme